MNDAILYAKSNSVQRITTKKVFAEFAPLLKWRKDGCDSILDIGCGTGDATIEIILPLLPLSFSRLLGCNISDEMIKYAQQHYGHPKVVFDKLDISGQIDEFLTKFGSFDHIVSFFCLHWVRNQKAAMENIYKLLTPNGNCLLLFITWANIYTIYDEMSKSTKWSQYMYDVKQYTSPYQHCGSPEVDLKLLLQSTGFTSYNIRIQRESYMCKDYEEFKSKRLFDNIVSVSCISLFRYPLVG